MRKVLLLGECRINRIDKLNGKISNLYGWLDNFSPSEVDPDVEPIEQASCSSILKTFVDTPCKSHSIESMPSFSKLAKGMFTYTYYMCLVFCCSEKFPFALYMVSSRIYRNCDNFTYRNRDLLSSLMTCFIEYVVKFLSAWVNVQPRKHRLPLPPFLNPTILDSI